MIEKSGFATLEAAKLAQAEERVKHGRGEEVIPTRLTVAAWLREWHEGLSRDGRKSLKPLTLESYGRHIGQHLVGPPAAALHDSAWSSCASSHPR